MIILISFILSRKIYNIFKNILHLFSICYIICFKNEQKNVIFLAKFGHHSENIFMNIEHCNDCIHFRSDHCRLRKDIDQEKECWFYRKRIINNEIEFSEKEKNDLQLEQIYSGRIKCIACKYYSAYGTCTKSIVRNYHPTTPNQFKRCENYESIF